MEQPSIDHAGHHQLGTWTSSVPAVATISSSGVATGVSAGATTITATIKGYTGTTTASATLVVSGSSGGVSPGAALVGLDASFRVLNRLRRPLKPASSSRSEPLPQVQRSMSPTLVTWSSSSAQIATVGVNTGLATAVGQGTVTITAQYTSGGSTLTATATFTVTSGTTEEYTAVTIIPSAQSVSASGQTGQFIALATSGTTGLEEDVTNSPQLKWVSSIPSIATITSGLASGNGLAAGVSQGSSAVTAILSNPDGSLVSDSASVNVTLTPAPEPLLSLTIVPNSITVGNLLDQGQFLAIGTYSTPPTVRDLTNSVTWLTSSPSVFPVNTNGTGVPSGGATAGIVTAYGTGGATIIAEATDQTTGSIETATQRSTARWCFPRPQPLVRAIRVPSRPHCWQLSPFITRA